MKVKKKWKVQFLLIGLTASTLIVFAIFIIIAEQLEYVQFNLGFTIANLSPMDSWLIIAIFPFGLTFYLTYLFLYKLQFLELN